ncbi:MAG TPA: hypothetical protein PKE29_03675 [Phycisphaerales bacterium]|nr:hypothetical protein [Phycisphaerales bacterium]
MSTQPSANLPPRERSPNDWLGALLGVVLIGFGIYLLVQSSGKSNFGPLLILLGVAFQPWSLLSIAGGLGLLAWAVWWTFFKALGPIDYIYSLVAAIIGLGTLTERWGRIKRGPRQ